MTQAMTQPTCDARHRTRPMARCSLPSGHASYHRWTRTEDCPHAMTRSVPSSSGERFVCTACGVYLDRPDQCKPRLVRASEGGWRSVEHIIAALLVKAGGEVTLTDEDLRRASRGTIKVVHVDDEHGETHCFVELAPTSPSEGTPEGT